MQQSDPTDLVEVRAFVALAETGSFTAAARRLGRDSTIVSRRIQALETRLGVRLAERTTRQVSLTEAGRAYLARVRPLLLELEVAEQEARAFVDGEPRGHLRLAVPGGFGRVWLWPMILGFLDRYRGVTVEMTTTTRYVDPIGEGYDVAVRIGELADSRLVVRKIADRRRVVCAAPDYLRRTEIIQVPSDLSRHSCLCFTNHSDPYRWTFKHRDDGAGDDSVGVSGPLASDDAELLVQGAMAGMGVLYTSSWYVEAELAAGQLVEVLTDHAAVDRGAVYIVTPAASHMPTKTRVFSDWIARRHIRKAVGEGS